MQGAACDGLAETWFHGWGKESVYEHEGRKVEGLVRPSAPLPLGPSAASGQTELPRRAAAGREPLWPPRRRALALLVLLPLIAGWEALPVSAQEPAEEPPAAAVDDSTDDDSANEDASQEAEARGETPRRAEDLPKLEDMEVPSVEELLKEPVDWIVLNNDDVVITIPIFPRPDTLNKLRAEIDRLNRLPRPNTPEGIEERRRERERLDFIEVSIPGSEEPEYRIHTRHIREITYHEDLILRRVGLLLDDGKLREAFELLFILERRQPEWEGIAEVQNRILFLEAEALADKEEYEQALAFLEDLHARRRDYPGLSPRIGQVADRLISAAVEADDFRRARHFLSRLTRREPEHEVAQRWTADLLGRATSLLEQSRSATAEGAHDAAARHAAEAARVWPAAPNLNTLLERAARRFQQLRAGVVRLPGEPAAYVLPSADDLREERLSQAPLFEVDRVDATPHYRTRFFDEWVPTDLGRQAVFQLKQSRSPSESQPLLTATSVMSLLLARTDPSSPEYDERLDSHVSGLAMLSPYRFQVRFARVPLRTETLFSIPVPVERFAEHERTEGRAAWRRAVPEPDGLGEYHVAEVVETQYESDEKAVQGLLRGEVSFLPRVRSWDLQTLRDDDRFFTRRYALPATHVLQFNPRNKALGNRELRRALAYGVDREPILRETVLRGADAGLARPISAPWASSLYAYDARLAPREHDMVLGVALAVAARQVLGGRLPELRMVCAPDPVVEAAAKRLIDQWARIGVQVALVDNGSAEGPAAEWDILYRTVQMTEPMAELWPFLTLEPRARVDALAHLPDWLRQELIELEHANDFSTAERLLKRLQRLLAAEVHCIPLWEVDEFMVVRRNIQGVPQRPMHAYHNVERWVVNPWYPRESP